MFMFMHVSVFMPISSAVATRDRQSCMVYEWWAVEGVIFHVFRKSYIMGRIMPHLKSLLPNECSDSAIVFQKEVYLED